MAAPQPFKLAGVIGWPIAQSRSPVLHGHWLKQYGVNGSYLPLPVQPERLPDAIKGLRALGFSGCNVTIPHKLDVLKLMEVVDPVAMRIGAVNTVVVQNDGTLTGFNTDAYGFLASLRGVRPEWKANAGPIVVLGAGGAARAVVVALLDDGANEIRLMNRTIERAQGLAQIDPSKIHVVDWAERHAALDGAALLVNTTSQGMVGYPPLDITLDALPVGAMVCDIVYNPLETPLLAAARKRGNTCIDGLGMLLHQAVPAFEAFFGVRPQVSNELKRAVADTL
ncbi:shikimate dehydrogenase [Pseudorhodoplanes sinuspersici]|uniref:Shikimate dehydrogenase (NADP(+)) n=1 Tax=Pseudorhodoplanes sinuspersici TaxID=1235591 RepID=A0A1W6ZRJ5_9HYPH|nr:shikimate dehydrogenase [Pseudorhodoplanes sinuspersici]ARP99384.1 shikimate dehydrogenase [Pseudorhodoplanes sinuspersici]RKE70321.1 shikimate dehydrogenase [Pseudorhodoplanes sinuspersici]